jgi:hypothetical protein
MAIGLAHAVGPERRQHLVHVLSVELDGDPVGARGVVDALQHLRRQAIAQVPPDGRVVALEEAQHVARVARPHRRLPWHATTLPQPTRAKVSRHRSLDARPTVRYRRRMRTGLALMLVLVGCSDDRGGGGDGGGGDLSTSDSSMSDLSMGDLSTNDSSMNDLSVTADLTMAPPPDLTGIDLTGVTFGPDLALTYSGDSGMCSPSGMTHAKRVINQLTLPQQRADFAIDLNGDGRTDNQIGNIVAALSSQGVNPQTGTDAAIASGSDIMLLDVESGDATFTNDSCTSTTYYNGVNMASPDFSGAGTFTIDNSIPSTFFSGPLAASRFSSTPLPPAQTVPERLSIQLLLFGSARVTLWGAHIQWLYSGPNLTAGQIHGAITFNDVEYVLVPTLAANLNQQIQSAPNSANSKQIEALFDTGGSPDPNFGACGVYCKGEDGQCGVPNDAVIQVCEVATNGIIKTILAPDVQMFQNGVYAPNPANTFKDSLSVGLGFTAVPASF